MLAKTHRTAWLRISNHRCGKRTSLGSHGVQPVLGYLAIRIVVREELKGALIKRPSLVKLLVRVKRLGLIESVDAFLLHLSAQTIQIVNNRGAESLRIH